MVDIDFSKKINDRFGHDVGDLVLTQMARLLTSNLRSRDFVCRFGGEEFVIVFQAATAEQAAKVLNRLLENAHQRQWGHRHEDLGVTFSCGLVTLSEGGGSLETMLKIADEKLYFAKEHGRDQIVVDPQACRHSS